jgi:hypothetical protein
VFACVVTKAVVGTTVTAAVTSVRINGAAAPTQAAFDVYGNLVGRCRLRVPGVWGLGF